MGARKQHKSSEWFSECRIITNNNNYCKTTSLSETGAMPPLRTHPGEPQRCSWNALVLVVGDGRVEVERAKQDRICEARPRSPSIHMCAFKLGAYTYTAVPLKRSNVPKETSRYQVNNINSMRPRSSDWEEHSPVPPPTEKRQGYPTATKNIEWLSQLFVLVVFLS